MVLIFSRKDDMSTSHVIAWLLHYKIPFTRVNKIDSFDQIKIQLSKTENQISLEGEKKLDTKVIKGYWFRRGGLSLKVKALPTLKDNPALQKAIESTNNFELKTISNYIYNKLDQVKSIGSYFMAGINKLVVLSKAQEAGLNIPDTLLTSCKDELIQFKKLHGTIITKAIYEGPTLPKVENNYFSIYTEIVEEKIIDKLPQVFFPSLFQECLEKKYELRVFYLEGKCKTMAIFSQEDQKTKIDFRHYNDEFPNRTSPFTLPERIEKKLCKLMESISLNCGSIDMVVSKKLEFHFLEVNPIGQFGMTSYPNNYYIERDIAEYFL